MPLPHAPARRAVLIRHIRRVVLALLLLAAAPILVCFLWFAATPVSVADFPPLKDGDLVFQTSTASQSVAISAATGSLYSHVGMIRMEGGMPIVVEAVGPVREIPLERWIGQGWGRRITIARIQGLEAAQARKALSAAKAFYGRPYDFYFLPNDEAIYCSELVSKAFAKGPGLKLGREQSIGQLHTDNIAVENLIRQRWPSYPPCHGSADYAACRRTILAQQLVSPASIAEDPQLTPLYSNYWPFR